MPYAHPSSSVGAEIRGHRGSKLGLASAFTYPTRPTCTDTGWWLIAAFVIFRVFVWVIVVSLVMYYSYSNCPILFFILIYTQGNCLRKIECMYIYIYKVRYSHYDGRGCMLEISLRAIATLRRASLWTQVPIVVMILNVNSFSNQTNYIGSSSSSCSLMKLVSNE